MKGSRASLIGSLIIGLLTACVSTATPVPPTAVPPTVAPVQAKSTAPAATEAAAPKAATVVKIGVLLPLTGSAAATGVASKEATELAVEIINNKYPNLDLPLAATEGLPNLGGAKIQLVVADHQMNPEKGASEAERLITQEGVVAILGAYASSVTATASQVAERLSIPFVNEQSTSATLHTRGFKWYFRTTPHDGIFAELQLKFLKDMNDTKKANIKTIATIYENTLYGTESSRVQNELAKKYGFEVVANVPYPAGTADMTSEVQKLKAANPDVVLPTSYVADAILMTKTFKNLGFQPKAIVAQAAGFTEAAFLQTIGSDGNGIMSREVFATDLAEKKPQIKVVNDMFKQRNGKEFEGATARNFTAMFVLADAINRAGSTKAEDIRQALLKTDIPAKQLIVPWQGVKFDQQTGQNMLGSGIIVQAFDGQYRTVYPFDLATKEMAWPFPGWVKK